MELRGHGGPALLFPNFRDMLCWEQLLHTVDQLLLLASTGLGSDLALPGWDRMTEVSWEGGLQIPGSAGTLAVSKHSSL